MREAALALELLLKAAICLRIRTGERTASVPLTHDLPKLWTEAGMEKPKEAIRRHHLERLRVVLSWSGRYPTAANADREAADLGALYTDMEHRMVGSMKVYRSTPLLWADFDALFSKVEEKITAYFVAHPGPS